MSLPPPSSVSHRSTGRETPGVDPDYLGKTLSPEVGGVRVDGTHWEIEGEGDQSVRYR